MSGICAVLRKDDPGRLPQSLQLVCAGCALEPEEQARTASSPEGVGVGVSMRFGHQQLYENNGTIVASDAELFNEDELRGLAGAPPAAGTAALLAALYQRTGPAFVEKLRGDFSIIVWDRQSRTLFAAIDGFGIHPLVYYEGAAVLLVATRIEGLMASGEVPRTVNPRAIATYLNYTVNFAPDTIFSGIARLLPGHTLMASGKHWTVKRYWDMRYEADHMAGERELSRRLYAAVEDAVRSQTQGAEPNRVGAFLSGGTDSSTVVGMMSRVGGRPARTFSIGFDDERFNELEYARITARKFAADHHEYLVTAADCVDSLENIVRYFDEPFGNSSAIPTYFCVRLAARSGVRTMLAGDGGDELFAGNERYLTDRVFQAYQRVPALLRKGLVEPALRGLPGQNRYVRLARSYVRRSNLPQPDRFFSYNLLLDNLPEAVFEGDFLASLDGFRVLERPAHYYGHGPAQAHLDRLLYLDVKITLADNDLLKVTRMAEMAGVKVRFPLLDRGVAEMSGTIPTRLKVNGTEKRYLFKRAFRELLPAEVIRKKKHGFGIPVAMWMKTDRRMREISRDVLLSPRTYERGYIRRGFVEELIRRHETDQTPFYGDTLWTFLVLELWLRRLASRARAVAR
jgi:asparagine synthase (glutamine-hydrolysing)